jgi:ribosomal protein S6--L-glutamate ligase
MMPPGTLERVIYRMDALNRLEAAGVPILNAPRAIEISADKYLSLARIAAEGLSVPSTIATESARDALRAFDSLGGDVVVKPLFGSEGRGLMRISERELARRAFSTLERLGAVIYLQRAIRHPGFDTRVFVLGGRVLGAMRRFAPEGDWRTNISLGGRPERCQLDSRGEHLAVAAARAVGADMAGIDLLDDLDRDEPVVLEANAVPGWRALARITGVDVAGGILTYLRELRR